MMRLRRKHILWLGVLVTTASIVMLFRLLQAHGKYILSFEYCKLLYFHVCQLFLLFCSLEIEVHFIYREIL